VKTETRTFYETAVETTIARIAGMLDDALDLHALAKAAGLSPFHFHRIFRGMVGETPLEMHRRLRLERAAVQLAETETAVTSIAFDAGWETHEAFTRAFKQAYGDSPSAYRATAAAARAACERPPQIELASAAGIHFRSRTLRFVQGGTMNVIIEDRPELRVATVAHTGPYDKISEAFARLGQLAGPGGLFAGTPEMLAIYYDDPETTPASELHSDAGLTVATGAALPGGLVEKRLPGGRYAKLTHVGPYTQLGDAWTRLMGQWLPKSGHRVGAGMPYEVYRNTPMDSPPEQLRTDLYLPLE
jgi:AraC family transcriptional regulator